jgi:predicted phosphoribosyltransferase
MFNDRNDAGKLLAKKLAKYRDKDAVVLALPRGGVVVGYEVAQALGLPLDIIVVCKIGHPNDPEYALGAVDEKRTFLCNELERVSVDKAWLAEEIERQRQKASRRVAAYRGERKAKEIKGKVAIIVDDGVATGLTMRLAIAKVREQKPARVVIAVPVAAPDVARELRREADEFITLAPPEEFTGAVGAHYRAFEQVEDKEVIRLLE